MRLVTVRSRVVAVFVVFAFATIAVVVRPFASGLSLVIRAADLHGTPRRLADLAAQSVTEREIRIDRPTGSQQMRGRLYWPHREPRRVTLLVSGLHPTGIDEPRLVSLARQLAASGIGVVTPDIPELSAFEITPAITDGIEAAALWLSTMRSLSRGGAAERVGLMGISFSGGLSIVAAGRPALRDRVAFVFSFGGHHDLPRVLRYLCTGMEPLPAGARVRLLPDTAREDGRVVLQPGGQAVVRPPHDYGVAIILLGVADRLVPAAQVPLLRETVRRFLWASYLTRVDKPQADREFAELRALAGRLPQPTATLVKYVSERDVVHLGARLLPYVSSYGREAALSVSKSPKPSAPVFLLHGADDNVIPAIESEFLADDLRGRTPVRLLLTRLISHAEVATPVRVGDVLQLASFWGDLLSR